MPEDEMLAAGLVTESPELDDERRRYYRMTPLGRGWYAPRWTGFDRRIKRRGAFAWSDSSGVAYDSGL